MSSAYFKIDFSTMQSSSEIVDFYFAFFPTMTTCGVDARDVFIKREKLHKANSDEEVHYHRFYGCEEQIEKFWLETDWFREPENQKQKQNGTYLQEIWRRLYLFRLAVYSHYTVDHSKLECSVCEAYDELVRFRDTMVDKRKLERAKKAGAVKDTGALPLAMMGGSTCKMTAKLQLDLDARRGIPSKYCPSVMLVNAQLDKTPGYEDSDAVYRKAHRDVMKWYDVESAKSAMRAAASCIKNNSVKKPQVHANDSLLDEVSSELVAVATPELRNHPWRCLAGFTEDTYTIRYKDPWRPLSTEKPVPDESGVQLLNKALKQRYSWRCFGEVGGCVFPHECFVNSDSDVKTLLTEATGINENGCPQFKVDWGLDSLIESVEDAYNPDDAPFCDHLVEEKPLRFAASDSSGEASSKLEINWQVDSLFDSVEEYSLFDSVEECFKEGALSEDMLPLPESPTPEDFFTSFERLNLALGEDDFNWMSYSMSAFESPRGLVSCDSPANRKSDGAVSQDTIHWDLDSLFGLAPGRLSSDGSSPVHSSTHKQVFDGAKECGVSSEDSATVSDLLTLREALDLEPELATKKSEKVCKWIKSKGKKIKRVLQKL